MAQSNQTIDSQQFSNIQPVWKFSLLYIITLGLYLIPWYHKFWKFIKERENLKINPWLRSWFGAFYLYSLCQKVFALAERQGYREKPSAFRVTFLYWLFFILGKLPHLLGLIALGSFVPLLPLLKAMNYYWEQEQPNLPKRESFSGGEIVWIVVGVILWLLVIIGMLTPNTQTGNG